MLLLVCHTWPSLTLAAWRRCGSSERIARLGRSAARVDLVKCVIAVPMMVTSATWSRPFSTEGHSCSPTRISMRWITTPSAPRALTSRCSWSLASCLVMLISSV